MEAIRVARAAAELLRQRGWLQGEWGRTQGPMCLSAAIGLAASEYGRLPPSEITVRHVCKRLAGSKSIGEWNDVRGRTLEQVIGLLERVVHELQEIK